ncbi:hypothetical protein GCM10009827_097260 [Dactylosporangium maewongense]|uniref:Uncharacterized protein n=1 Tax=Dactylosporangium maewongense TaxID=634393 RepID=A0ABN2CL53_9ACTN
MGAHRLIERSRSLSGLTLAASVVAFGLSVSLLPPIVLFGVATVAFGWRRRAARSPEEPIRSRTSLIPVDSG